MAAFQKITLFGMLLGGCLMALLVCSKGFAVMEYDRQTAVRTSMTNPHAPYRFGYTHPNYNPRKTQITHKCIPLGLSRCLGNTKKNRISYQRYPNHLRVEKVHPYLRRMKKYQAQYSY